MSVYGTREKELKSLGENESSVAHMKAWSNIPENLKSGMSGKASAGSTFEFWQKNYIYFPFSPILILPGVNKIGYLIFCNTFFGGKKGTFRSLIRHGLQDICLLYLMHEGLSTTHLREAFQLLLPLNVA